jgi:asparaginyl-tRNA synthetase
MNTLRIRDINKNRVPAGEYTISGWIRSHRTSKNVAFIDLTDGTGVKGLQVVVDTSTPLYASVKDRLTTGASIKVEGSLTASAGQGQAYDFNAKGIEILGDASVEEYPLQKKGHTLEFLRTILHLRPRSNTFGAVFRLRSVAAMAVHTYFQERGFYYLNSPIITSSDCEGAGQMFRVTTLNMENPPKHKDGKINYEEDFFKQEASLTVSGQLEGEMFATALSKVYTFGPTFRAENSNTARHLAEFWMIEPEMAFYDLNDNMALAEDFTKFIIKYVLERCDEEMAFFDQWVEKGILSAVQKVADSKFGKITYTEAIDILLKSGKKFDYPVKWGIDLQSEHERFLTDEYFKGPTFVTDYPKEIKAFYMRLNEDGKTVRAMDMLVPRIGELIGGSQREERHDVLKQKIIDQHMKEEDLWWYLELRKFGTVPHAGFGLGFERFLMYMTGMQNIRDVVPCPRFPGFSKF